MFNAKRLGVVVSAIAIAAGTTQVLAQSSPEKEGAQEKARSFTYERPLGAKKQDGKSGGRSVMVSESSDDNGHKYSVRIEDGKVASAKVDGKEIAKERVRQTDSEVQFLDESGNVQYSLHIAPAGAMKIEIPSLTRRGFLSGAAPAGQVEGWTPPPVMLGITMSEPDDDVAEHLGVKADEVIRVDTVLDGLPAAQAGLKVHDIIVAVDGNKPVNQEKLREILRGKKPGDHIQLSIISKGKKEDVSVTLDAYDSQKLGAPVIESSPDENWWQNFGADSEAFKDMLAERWSAVQPQVDEARRVLNETLEQVAKMSDESAGAIRDHVKSALEEALKKLDEHAAAGAKKMSRLQNLYVPTPPSTPQADGQGRPKVFITPVPPAAQGDQFDRLTAAVERMEKRLAELEHRLDKRQQDQGGHNDDDRSHR